MYWTRKGARALIVGVFLMTFTLATFPITHGMSGTADDVGVEEAGWSFVAFGIVRLLLLIGGGVLIIGGYLNIRDERERTNGEGTCPDDQARPVEDGPCGR